MGGHLENTQIDSFFSDNKGTLYGVGPVQIASMVQNKLNWLSVTKNVYQVVALPDYHTFTGDGGNKDILFFSYPRTPNTRQDVWYITLAVYDDWSTMYRWETHEIIQVLYQKIYYLESGGYRVGGVVALTDYHNFYVMTDAPHGFDGVKNFIICYYLP